MPIYTTKSGGQPVHYIKTADGQEKYRVYVVDDTGRKKLVYSKIIIHFYETDSYVEERPYYYGEGAPLMTPSRSGYIFKGWFFNGEPVEKIPDTWWTGDIDYYLHAKWVSTTVHIYFKENEEAWVYDSNGIQHNLIIQTLPSNRTCSYGQTLGQALNGVIGDYRTQENVTLYFRYGQKLSWESTIKFTFDGWSSKPDGSSRVDEDIVLEDDIILYPILKDKNIKDDFSLEDWDDTWEGTLWYGGWGNDVVRWEK